MVITRKEINKTVGSWEVFDTKMIRIDQKRIMEIKDKI